MVNTIQFMIMIYHLPDELHKKRVLLSSCTHRNVSFCSQKSVVAYCIKSDKECVSMSHSEDVLTTKNRKSSKKSPESYRICPPITIKDKMGRSHLEFVRKFKV